jgi:hypothetical protein
MSAKYSLDKKDTLELVKNAVLVGLAAVLTYVGEHLSSLDLGTTGVLMVPVVTVVIQSVIKWAKGEVTVQEEGK